jgi:hypothetical protein
MFTHQDASEDEESDNEATSTTPQLCAATQQTRLAKLQALKGHLKELSKFSDAELIAALDDGDENMEEEEADSQATSNANSDDSDDDSEA